VPRIANLLKEWKDAGVEQLELTRRLIDLFFVSVLLDAGAGDQWRYVEPGTDTKYERSEGIAVASLYMFKALDFTVDKARKSPLVDGRCPRLCKPFRCSLTRMTIRHGLEAARNLRARRRFPDLRRQSYAGGRRSRNSA
jgi:hypothetical protein